MSEEPHCKSAVDLRYCNLMRLESVAHCMRWVRCRREQLVRVRKLVVLEAVVVVEHKKEQRMELQDRGVRPRISCCSPESIWVSLLEMDWADLVVRFVRVRPNRIPGWGQPKNKIDLLYKFGYLPPKILEPCKYKKRPGINWHKAITYLVIRIIW